MEKLRTVRGVHDLLPNELHKHKEVIDRGLEIADRYNYSQIEIPIFEYAEVFNNFYGTERQKTEKILKSKDLLLELDWQGAFNIKEKFIETKNIFLIPPSFDDLKKRLKNRGTESNESIEMRLSAAKEEISKHSSYDYLVLNDNFEFALEDLKKIVLNKVSVKDFESRVTDKLLNKLLD